MRTARATHGIGIGPEAAGLDVGEHRLRVGLTVLDLGRGHLDGLEDLVGEMDAFFFCGYAQRLSIDLSNAWSINAGLAQTGEDLKPLQFVERLVFGDRGAGEKRDQRENIERAVKLQSQQLPRPR